MPERKPYAPPPTVEKTPVSRDPYAAFRYRGFVLFTLGNFVSIAGRQMLIRAGRVGHRRRHWDNPDRAGGRNEMARDEEDWGAG
jgi:hypothetical protein